MQRGMLIRRRPQRDPRQVFLGEPDAPTFVPPDVLVGKAIHAQEERDQNSRVSNDVAIDFAKAKSYLEKGETPWTPAISVVFGFGISLDAYKMHVAVVVEAPEEAARGMLQAMDASPYLAVRRAASVHEAEQALALGEVRGLLVVREDFMQRLRRPSSWPATAGLAVNATDPSSTSATSRASPVSREVRTSVA